MLKLAKSALMSGALVALTAFPAAAQNLLQNPVIRCQSSGGQFVDGKCEMPAKPAAPAETPNQNGPRAGAPQGRGTQGAVQPENTPQGAGRGEQAGRGQGAVQPQNTPPDAGRGRGQGNGNVQQGNGQPQGGRGQVQQGALQQSPPPAPVQQDRGQQRDDRNGQRNNAPTNNFGQRDNGQYGNDRNNNFGPRDNNNNFGQRDNGQFGNNRNNTVGRNFDQNEFNRRYYGRYGNDPNNFARNRQAYRAQQQWRERYPHDFVYADDSYYRDCRTDNQVGGAIIGAILGGLLGNSLSNGQGGATLAGVIFGGVGGASLARNLDCEDRTYLYGAYYDGFERGRRQTNYPWRNDRTGDYGTLSVGDYYQDQDNYRCATYSQTIYVRGVRQIGRGHACRQSDGTWALVD